MTNAPAHVPIRRILEQVTALPGVQPLRIFPLLLPMWAVRVRSVVQEAQPYEVFDRYLSRAIGRAGLRDVPGLAAFFAVEPALVERALGFLDTVGHLRRDGDALGLTEIGLSSVADGQRYVLKEDQQILYFDGFTGAALPKAHYAGAVWLDEPQLSLSGSTRFHPVASSGVFRMDTVVELARRADREKFNLPGALKSVEPLALGNSWLPAYVVACASGLLVYVKAIEGADPYLSKLVAPYLRDALAAEKAVDDVRVWREWLAGRGFRDVEPRRLPNRILRASLPVEAFPERMKWWQLGSFETRENTFLQLWCDDEPTRLRAVLVRAGSQVTRRGVRDVEGIERRLGELSKQLEVPTPGVESLRVHARAERDDVLNQMLENMTADR
ncbi:hypothetical protein [Actinoplanes sp. NPDC026623]|uniref:hypothetical protein n=1 Tax=Actinoplanes sp. NPDC026623 TaxID=3155610 RepID=UPI0033CBA352